MISLIATLIMAKRVPHSICNIVTCSKRRDIFFNRERSHKYRRQAARKFEDGCRKYEDQVSV